MAKGSGSVGARRGGKVEDNMSMADAKKLQKTGSSKPSLSSLKKNQSKVTNKPKADKVL